MGQVWLQSALWIGLALIASIVSIRVAISVALVEILVGVARRQHDRPAADRMGEFPRRLRRDPADFSRRNGDRPRRRAQAFPLRPSIGVVGFFAPYLGVLAYAHFAIDWPWDQAQIAGISLSTTSVAVVYAVMIETGFNRTEIGKIILAACFINDLGTVLALGVVFSHYDMRLALFGAVTAAALWLLPRFAPWFFAASGIASASRKPSSSPWCCSGSAASPWSRAARRCCPPISSAWRWRRPFSPIANCRTACASSPSPS